MLGMSRGNVGGNRMNEREATKWEKGMVAERRKEKREELQVSEMVFRMVNLERVRPL